MRSIGLLLKGISRLQKLHRKAINSIALLEDQHARAHAREMEGKRAPAKVERPCQQDRK